MHIYVKRRHLKRIHWKIKTKYHSLIILLYLSIRMCFFFSLSFLNQNQNLPPDWIPQNSKFYDKKKQKKKWSKTKINNKRQMVLELMHRRRRVYAISQCHQRKRCAINMTKMRSTPFEPYPMSRPEVRL